MILILLVPLILIIGFWFFGFIKANDFSVTDMTELPKFKKVLVVFPHVDDEAQSTGGLMTKFSESGTEVTLLILTKGEKGNADAHFDESLKEIRVKEAKNAAKVFKVGKLILKDYPDNNVSAYKTDLTKDLHQTLTEILPDLVITYDQSGLYGHPDHIAASEVLTGLIKQSFPNIQLWYISVPKKLIDQMTLPEHMATDNGFSSKRMYPTFKHFTGFQSVLNKIRVIYGYKSQLNSFKEAVPIKSIPLWFYITIRPYEYFYEVK